MSTCKLTPRAIKDAIIRELKAALPGTTQIYEDLVPRDFQRPAVLVELTGGTMLPLLGNRNTVPLQWMATLTGLVEADEVHNSHLPELDDLGWLLQTIWAAGKLKVADRALDLDKVELNSSAYDNTVVTLRLSIQVDRDSLLPAPPGQDAPLMEDVAIGQKIIK